MSSSWEKQKALGGAGGFQGGEICMCPAQRGRGQYPEAALNLGSDFSDLRRGKSDFKLTG